MNKLAKAYWTFRALGAGNIPRCLWQAFKSRAGILERHLPGGELSAEQLQREFVDDYRAQSALSYWKTRANHFFISPEQLPQIQEALNSIVESKCWEQNVTNVVNNLQKGSALFFSRFFVDAGWPMLYNRDPVNHLDWPVGRHWSTYKQFDPHLKDIKCIWELSRFSTAYYLAREYTRNFGRLPIDLFWQMFESWDEQNPYGLTVQWACGQESTFRMMAWLFSAFVFLSDSEADADRYHRLTELAWYTGRHLERNINFALSQKNNHGISEAVGLWTIGLLFPELRSAKKWRERGWRILTTEPVRQIYEDGAYVQHSFNYHRLMMDDLLWVACLGQANDFQLPENVMSRFERSLHWLLEMVEPTTGRVPNYGANDGASILPLSCCDYLDYRPVIQAAHYLLYHKRFFNPGPWDEKMLWLVGPESLDAEPSFSQKVSFAARTGGYYVLRGSCSWAMTRCHSYCDRPSQADMLHVDLWYKGENILRDAGTYMYYCEPAWQKYFLSTAAHNCIVIDGADQMTKGPRFLWFRWIRSRLLSFDTSTDGRVGYFAGEHYGYTCLIGNVIHRRSICRIDNTYVIIDDIVGRYSHDIAMRWRLPSADWQRQKNSWRTTVAGQQLSLTVIAPEAMSCALIQGQEAPYVEGWESLYYCQKKSTPTLVIKGNTTLPVCMVTIISTLSWDVKMSTFKTREGTAIIMLRGIDDSKLARCVDRLSAGRIKCV